MTIQDPQEESEKALSRPPDVTKVLADAEIQGILTVRGVLGFNFDPVEISGDLLSETILCARR